MRWNRATPGAALPRSANSRAERDARRHLPSSLSRLPPREQRRGNCSGRVINPTGLHTPLSTLVAMLPSPPAGMPLNAPFEGDLIQGPVINAGVGSYRDILKDRSACKDQRGRRTYARHTDEIDRAKLRRNNVVAPDPVGIPGRPKTVIGRRTQDSGAAITGLPKPPRRSLRQEGGHTSVSAIISANRRAKHSIAACHIAYVSDVMMPVALIDSS